MRIFLFTILFCLFSLCLWAGELLLDFRQGSAQLTLEDKEKLIDYFSSTPLRDISQVKIQSNTSPEGSDFLNDTLSFARAKSVETFIKQQFELPDSLVVSHCSTVDWRRFNDLLWLYDVPYKNELSQFVLNQNIDAIKTYRNGECYSYLYKFIYPQLRTCSVVVECKEKKIEYRTITYFETEIIACEREVKPLFAFKTNLLFDALALINVEIEVPLSQRISLATEFIFPWWSSETSDFTFELRSFHLGVNYWLGDRTFREVMTGWSVGFFGGYGLYDFQIFNSEGIQGRFFDVSLSAGYAHKIARNLRMEYQLGVGYLRSKYEKYDDIKETVYGDIKVVDYPWQKYTLNWVGATRARVSLVWMINSIKR